MKTRRLRVGVAAAASVMLILGACGNDSSGDDGDNGSSGDSGSALESMEPVTFRVSNSSPETSSGPRSFQAMADYVEEKTDGKVSFEFFYSSSLSPADQALSSVESGLADIAFSSISFDPEELPISTWFQPVTSAQGTEFPIDAIAGTLALNDLYTTNQTLLDEYIANGVRPVAMVSSPPFPMICNKEIDGVDGFKGLRIRTAGGVWQQEVEALGAENVFLPSPEQYEGFQRGIIDCGITVASAILASSFQEVAKFFYPLNFSPTGGSMFIINEEKWQALPDEVKEIFIEAQAAYMATYFEAGLGDNAKLLETDVQTKILPDVNEFLLNFQKDLRAELPGSAPDGVDGAALVSEYEELVEKWRGALAADFSVEGDETTVEGLTEIFNGTTQLDWAALQAQVLEQLQK